MTEPSPRDRSLVRRGPVRVRRAARPKAPARAETPIAAAGATSFVDLAQRPVAEHVAVFETEHARLAARARHDRPTLMARRSRLDAELVRRGLARSREHAVTLIAEGRVAVAGRAATKPATGVDAGTPVVVRTDPDAPQLGVPGRAQAAGRAGGLPGGRQRDGGRWTPAPRPGASPRCC